MFFFVILFIIFIFIACSTPQYTIDNVEVDGASNNFMVSLKISGKSFIEPSILITENRKPSSANDGIIMNGYSFLYKTDNSQVDKLYFTLINREKFISSPYEYVIDKTTYTLDPPDIEVNFVKGEFLIEAITDYESDLTFNFAIDNMLFSVTEKEIFYTPESTEEINGSCFIVDNETEEKSQRVFFSFKKPPDNSPNVKVLEASFDANNSIKVTIKDDYDDLKDLSINATCSDTPCFFNGGSLYLEFPLDDGIWPLQINVIDSSGNSTIINKNVNVKNIPSDEIPVLYIEEGASRKAKWISPSETNDLQLFKNNIWNNIQRDSESSDKMTVQSEYINKDGDIYRLLSSSIDKKYLPSVPVFAIESFYKRYSSDTILSLFGANTFLPGFQEYKIMSSIAIPNYNVLKIDNGASINLSMGSTILLSGILDIDGKEDRVRIFSGSNKNSIEINNGGILIARGVNFDNINLQINEGAVVVLYNCDFIDGSIKIQNANTVYFYNSNIESDISLNSIDELNIFKSSLSDKNIRIQNSSNLCIYDSQISAETLEILFMSKGNVYKSTLTASSLLMEGNVYVNMFNNEINSDKIELKKGSTVVIKNSFMYSDEIVLSEISMIKSDKEIENIELKDFSDIKIYDF